jgi:glutamate-1-semialdehyde 2,1-aminomutase
MYPDERSKSAALFRRAVEVMPGGNSRHTVFFRPYPIYIERAHGARIVDVDGVERIDCINNYSSLIHGHNHPKVVEAIKAQADRVLSVGLPTEQEIELAETITARVPGVEQIRFGNSGTEGVMFAIKAARAYTNRPKIVKIEGAYHGSSDTAEISLNPNPANWGDVDAPASVAPAGIGPGAAADTLVVPMNDVARTRRILEAHADEIAGVIIDPMVNKLGFLAAAPDYVAMLRDVTRARGMLLIFDEVYSFRLGFHGAQGALGVTPDLTALGKVIGGGLPVGAIGGRADIMTELFDPRTRAPRLGHGGTFNANPMTMAAGVAAMRLYDRAAFDRLATLGDRLRAGLAEALRVAQMPGIVRGASSMIGLFHTERDFADYRELTAMMTADRTIGERSNQFFRHMLNDGVYMASQGFMVLSTAMTETDIDFIVEKSLGALRSIAKTAA